MVNLVRVNKDLVREYGRSWYTSCGGSKYGLWQILVWVIKDLFREYGRSWNTSCGSWCGLWWILVWVEVNTVMSYGGSCYELWCILVRVCGASWYWLWQILL